MPMSETSNSEQALVEFKKENNIQVIIDFIKNDKEFEPSTNVAVFIQYLDDLLDEGYSQDDITRYILAIKEQEETDFPKLMKYINRIKESDVSEYHNHLFLFSHTMFETDSIRKYNGLFINYLMEKHLDKDTYQLCLDIVYNEHMDFIKESASFDETPDWGDGDSQSRSHAFNANVLFCVDNMSRSFLKDRLLACYFDFVREDLKNKTFEYNGKSYLFTSISLETYNDKNVLKWIGTHDGKKESIPYNKVLWTFKDSK